MRSSLFHAGWALTLIVSAPLIAQTQSYSGDAFADLPQPSSRSEHPPSPKLAFHLEAEIPLPGPLPPRGPRLRGDRIEIPVAGGTMLTEPVAEATPRRVAVTGIDDPVPDATAWVMDDQERARYRALPGGAIEAQRRCRRCKAGWKRKWKLRVAGNTVAPPLVADGRVYFGALDNRLYCVKARSGHRVWATDLGGRLSSRLVRWHGATGPASSGGSAASVRPTSLILAVPDGGAEMKALDSERGETVAEIRMNDREGKLVNGPLATPDGKIVVARQKYVETEASLMVYRLRPLQPAGPPAAEGSRRNGPSAEATRAAPEPGPVSVRSPAPGPR